MASFRLRVRNAAQLVCVSTNPAATRLVGADMDKAVVIENGGLVVDNSGKIVAVGTEAELTAQFPDDSVFQSVLDATGRTIVPGLVDAHTHACFAGDRVHEFSLKLAGASYLEVHNAGGGIHFTVASVRQSSEEDLLASLLERLDLMLANGSTLVEVKSGYGLDTDSEIKMLRVIHRAAQLHPVDIVSNFCGGHSIPKGSTAAAACDVLVKETIPAVKAATAQGQISPELVDVFCEKGVFELEHSRAILAAGQSIGLAPAFHGDELNPLGSAEMGASIQATSISHLEHVSEEGMRAMAATGVVAVLLPTTAYILRIEYPPARKLISAGVPVALGSDFNPNAPCLSMPLVMHLAAVQMKMTLSEALVASTLNAAESIKRGATHGSLAPGKVADFVLLDAPHWHHIIYQLGAPPILSVYKRGRAVYNRPPQAPRAAREP